LIEAWFLVERDVFLLAADRATTADREHLDEVLEQLYAVRSSPAAAFQEVTFRIHTVAATTARNPFLKRYYSMLMNILGTTFTHRGNLDNLTTARRQKVLADYDELLDALAKRDHERIDTIVGRRAALQRRLMGI
jgi:DNA-binding FadR family transcriptional regulator